MANMCENVLVVSGDCILRPPAATIPFWSGRFTEQNGRNVAIDYPLL